MNKSTNLPAFLLILLFFIPGFAATAQNVIDGFSLGKGKVALSYSWERYDEFYFGDEILA